MEARDTVYSTPRNQIGDFTFNAEVARVFDDMITRSVPIYQATQLVSAKVASEVYQPGTRIYDLGCSTGETIIRVAEECPESKGNIIGIDSSQEMLKRAEEKLSNDCAILQLGDVTDVNIENASVVYLNFTLQFIPEFKRPKLLQNIRAGLTENGVLVLAEKLTHHNPKLESLLVSLHHGYKREQGYSELEISQKRDALERVLTPLTENENRTLLRQAGFSECELVLKYYNFGMFIARA